MFPGWQPDRALNLRRGWYGAWRLRVKVKVQVQEGLMLRSFGSMDLVRVHDHRPRLAGVGLSSG